MVNRVGSVATVVRPRRILLRCPEITLKGKNRGDFEHRLVENVIHRLRRMGLDWRVHYAHGRLYVDVAADVGSEVEPVLQALSQVAGVDAVSLATWLKPSVTCQHKSELDREVIEQTMLELVASGSKTGGTFAVRVNRVDKRLPMNSMQMERWLGEVIRMRSGWKMVDLDNPDRTFSISAYPDGMYFYDEKRRGIGGLPVGMGGRALALLSGGIDSPVAAFLVAKRGCQVDFFHLTATHSQQRDPTSPVVKLARQLSRYTLGSRLFTAPATHFDLSLVEPSTGFEPILFRRFLVRTAEALARRIGASAIVTGDSLGQVASQTIENLVSVYKAAEMPALHPLIGFNKQETIALARRIGTYETSVEKYKDCCALLAQSPRTKSDPDRLAGLEAKLMPDYQMLIDNTLSDLAWHTVDCGEAVGEWREDFGLDQSTHRSTRSNFSTSTSP